jgi:hypothetical protein
MEGNINSLYEDEVVPVHIIKAYWGSRGVAPHILNLGNVWKVNGLLYVPGKEPIVPTEQEAVLAPELVWLFWRGDFSLTPAGI